MPKTTALNGLLWRFSWGKENKLSLLALQHKKHFSHTLINMPYIHTNIYIVFPLKAVLLTYPDSSEGNLMLLQACSVHTCIQPPSACTGAEDMSAHGFVVQTCRCTYSEAGHKAWTDKCIDLHVYPAISATYPGGYALHTFLAWWMLQFSCHPGHPKHKLEHHQVPIRRKPSQALEERLWTALGSAAGPCWTN